MSKFLKRRADDDGTPRIAKGSSLAAFVKEFPALHEFLTVTKWDEDTRRITGSMNCFFEDGVYKLCLSDRDQGYVAFVTVDDPVDGLRLVESQMRDGTIEWRRSGKSRK